MAVPVNEPFELVLPKERQVDKEIVLNAQRQRQLLRFVLPGKCQCISLAIFCAHGLEEATLHLTQPAMIISASWIKSS